MNIEPTPIKMELYYDGKTTVDTLGELWTEWKDVQDAQRFSCRHCEKPVSEGWCKLLPTDHTELCYDCVILRCFDDGEDYE